jgi:phosphate-selective porin OprO/OprP
MRRTGTWWIAGALLAALVLPLHAAQEKPKAEDKPPADEKPKEPATKVSAGKDGFLIQSEDGAFRLRIAGYAHADGRFYAGDEDQLGTNAFLLRRVRPIVSGTLGRIFDFTIMPDFGGGVAVLQDGYLEARYSEKARLRVGKFKAPFGLERLQSATVILFAERALPSSLAPIRDVGVQLHGELGGGVAAYALGVFDGALDGASVDTDTNDGKDVAGRLFLQPFKTSKAKAAQGIGIGIAASTGKQEGLLLPLFRTPGQLVFFNYAAGVTADGTRTRVSPQASYANGPFRLIGEYVRSSQDVRRESETSRVTNDAWQATAAFILTGETPAGGVVSPKAPFEKGKGWGAFELAARYSELDVDDAVFARGLADPVRSASRAKAIGLGLNWYLTKNFKYVADYERTTFEGGRAGGDRETENALLFRAQVSF